MSWEVDGREPIADSVAIVTVDHSPVGRVAGDRAIVLLVPRVPKQHCALDLVANVGGRVGEGCCDE